MFLKIGHRGAKFYAPENTLKSFDKAIKLGVNAVEIDVRKTKDKKLIVFHDEVVDFLTQGRGLVRSLSFEEIKQLDVKGESIPTFDKVLSFLDKKVEKIIVELKVGGIEKKVLKEISKRKLKDRVIITSFLASVLKKIRDLDNDIETGWIYAVAAKQLRTAAILKVNYLLPSYRFCTYKLVNESKRRGLKVLVWTINNEEKAKKYVKKGVAGIITDKPDILNFIRNN